MSEEWAVEEIKRRRTEGTILLGNGETRTAYQTTWFNGDTSTHYQTYRWDTNGLIIRTATGKQAATFQPGKERTA